MANNDKIIKYRGPVLHFNIGILIFLIIIIYVGFNVFSYFTKHEIAEYEVQQGAIASNHVYQGIIVRDETIEYSTAAGYVDYFVKNKSKVAGTNIVYSVDILGNISNEIASSLNTSDKLSQESLDAIVTGIDDFLNVYNANRFTDAYNFYNNLSSEIVYNVSSNALSNMTEKISQAEANQTFTRYKAEKDGVIVYEYDGFEDKSTEELLEQGYDSSSYQKTYLTANRKVNIGDPVYKRINSEHWDILLPIEESLAKTLNEKNSVSIRFCKDNYTTNAACSILKKHNIYYLKLSLKTAMIRYVQDRFIDVELMMNATSGLKIPNSAITTKEFFTVPKEFFTAETQQLLVQTPTEGKDASSMTTTLVSPTIYYETDTYYYIDNEHIAAGSVLLKPDSVSTYILGTHTDSLKGVYNINKGYAVFKQINLLYEGDSYSIIETKTAYGISLYDHIALDASAVKENQLIAR